MKDDNVENAGGYLAIDGLSSDSSLVYHSKWPIADPSFPWVQVEMDKKYYVKSVTLSQRTAWGARHTHKEVTLYLYVYLLLYVCSTDNMTHIVSCFMVKM